jgi:hypothetical protein
VRSCAETVGGETFKLWLEGNSVTPASLAKIAPCYVRMDFLRSTTRTMLSQSSLVGLIDSRNVLTSHNPQISILTVLICDDTASLLTCRPHESMLMACQK